MIYLLAIAVIATVFGFAHQSRQKGFLAETINMAVAAICGLLGGFFIGFGARVGMLAIALANGDELRLSVSGTIQVIAVFACLGIVFGLIYEGLFRHLFRLNGFVFGLLIALLASYPLADAAAQVLTVQVSTVSLYIATFSIAVLMFAPFGWCLEMLLKRWHLRQSDVSSS